MWRSTSRGAWLSGERSDLTNTPGKGGSEMGDKSPKATQKQKKQKDAKKTDKKKE